MARRITRCAHFVRYAQTDAPSQITRRASRAGHEPCAARRLTRTPRPARTPLCGSQWLFAANATTGASRQVGSGRGDFWGAEPGHGQSSGLSVPGEGPGHWPGAACKAEKRRAGVGARQRASSSDSSQCLSAVSAANEASFATRPRTEHRSAVGAKRRPPQHEPLPEPACRDALTSPKSGHPATSAMGRTRSSGSPSLAYQKRRGCGGRR
jgi:hypothetical protein